MTDSKKRYLWERIPASVDRNKTATTVVHGLRQIYDGNASIMEAKEASANAILCIRDLAARSGQQEQQLQRLVKHLKDTMDADELIRLMDDCGINRNEQVSIYGIDPDFAVQVQERSRLYAKNSTYHV